MKLVRKLPDDTKKLISDAIKSDSAPISCKDARKKKGKKGFVKSAAVIAAYAGDSLGGVELFVNTLHSGPMPGIAVVDAWVPDYFFLTRVVEFIWRGGEKDALSVVTPTL